jgi:hypothetical protein
MRTAIALFLVAFGYFGLLSAREYTWLFVSQDSGDWLAASTIWFVPQPLGSPLYILLGHFLNLFPGSLPAKMTILLSCLPSAVTIALVYLVVRHLTGKPFWALVSGIALLGAGIFLSQSTILEEYALTTMFLVAGFYAYLHNRKHWTLLLLGLATAIHIIGLIIALLWWIVERRRRVEWLKHSWVYILCGVLPYSYVLVLMALRKPPFLAGYLSWSGLYEYLFSTSGTVVGQLSIFDFPLRLITLPGLLVFCLGIGLIPVWLGLSRPWEKWKWVLVVSAFFPVVYYMTAIDPSTWTFLTFGLPFMCILLGLGLSRLQPNYVKLIPIGAVILIILNGVFLNAGQLAKAEPYAAEVKATLESLPAGSGVLTVAGTYSLCLFYVIADGHDLVPILWSDINNDWPGEYDLPQQYLDYCEHMYEPRGISSTLPIEVLAECIDEWDHVYMTGPEWLLSEGSGNTTWTWLLKIMETEDQGRVREIISIDRKVDGFD